MSLHALAGHMAAKGRGPDSMLVHMTPEEVQSLQVLALKGGGTLTINPETGLPEANFLKKMLPMIAGFALGPAGFGLLSAGMAGAAVGGITALSTGSLSRGLMAGLGAYGGASLGAGLAGTGAGAAQEAAMAGLTGEQLAQQAAAQGLTEQGVLNQAAATATKDFMAQGIGDKLMQGASAAFNNPSSFIQSMGGPAKALGAAYATVSPMMADEGVKTATPRQDTGMVRNYTFDPYSQTYTSSGNYPASEYKGMADGGIVALAAGGDYRSLTKDSSAADIASAYKQFTTAGGGDTQANQAAAIDYLTNLGIDQDRIGQAYTQFQAAPTYTDYTQQNVTDYLQANPNIDIAAETARLNANPLLVNQAISQIGAGYLDPGQTTGGSGAGQYYDAFTSAGIDANELYAANRALNPDDSGISLDELQRAFDVAKQFDTYEYGKVGSTELLKDIDALKQYDLGGFGGDKSQQILDIARETGLSLDETTRRYDAARAAMQPKAVIPGPIDEVGNLPGGVSGGGNTVVNANGTITTAPDIPGRPEGGFTGTGQVKDVYTQGGGSTGYVSKAPTSMAEFNERFNRQTGDSLDAYRYLMGKGEDGVAPKYPYKSGVAQLMRPYSEATLGIPAAEGRPTQKYIFDAATKRYVENPNYRPLSYNNKGERVVGLTPTEVIKGITPFKDGKNDAGLFDFVTQNRISELQLAAALGIPLVEARARLAAVKKTRAATNTAQDELTGQGGDDSPAPPGEEDPDAFSMDGVVSTATGGLLPRRMALGGLGALAKGGVAELPDGAFVVPSRITSELGNGSTNAGAQKLHAMEQRLLGKNAQPVNLGRYSGGGNLVRGAGDGVSDSVPATIGGRQPARIADGEYIFSQAATKKLGKGSTEAGARKLYAMMDRVQKARGKTTGKKRVAANTRADKYLPA
jgi:hypothetical protein